MIAAARAVSLHHKLTLLLFAPGVLLLLVAGTALVWLHHQDPRGDLLGQINIVVALLVLVLLTSLLVSKPLVVWLERLVTKPILDMAETARSRCEELQKSNRLLQNEIQQRVEVEMALRESEERFRSAFETIPTGLAILDRETHRYLDVNESFLRLCGRSRAQVLGQTSAELGLLAEPYCGELIAQSIRAGESAHELPIGVLRPDGALRESLVSVEPLELGERPCLLAAVIDVTEQRHLEEQLRQAHKMEAIGRLAAGVAHDFNNMLTVIGGYTSMQLGRGDLNADTEKAFARIKLATERGSLLTKSLLTFSRKQPVKRVSLDLAQTVMGLRNLLTGMVGETIQIEMACDKNLPRVSADPGSMHQVVMNLVLNAREAMPDGGLMAVEVTSRPFSLEDMLGSEERRAGMFVVLTVADTGCGMDRETMLRIFEPFFTTKPFGHGAGLGLATVYGLVEQHDGWVEVKSEPGQGSRFQVFLPVEAQPEPGARENGTSRFHRQPGGRRETVLVVEDETEVRELLVSILRQQGYQVEQASSGAHALHQWNRFGSRIDLLLTDMVMPGGVSGSKLAQSLLRQQPDLKVIYTSGYSADEVPNEHSLREGTNFLAKPFSPDRLYATVRAALDGDSRAVELMPA